MNRKSLEYTLTLLFSLMLIISAPLVLAQETVVGEDGRVIIAGEEITDGIGIIDEISFSDGYAIISDVRFLLDENTELINKRRKYASQQIFVPGVRVVWTARGGTNLVSLDHYPFDAPIHEENEENEEIVREQRSAVDSGAEPVEITQGEDGVYRN